MNGLSGDCSVRCKAMVSPLVYPSHSRSLLCRIAKDIRPLLRQRRRTRPARLQFAPRPSNITTYSVSVDLFWTYNIAAAQLIRPVFRSATFTLGRRRSLFSPSCQSSLNYQLQYIWSPARYPLYHLNHKSFLKFHISRQPHPRSIAGSQVNNQRGSLPIILHKLHFGILSALVSA